MTQTDAIEKLINHSHCNACDDDLCEMRPVYERDNDNKASVPRAD
jgi:hypothetical protein